MIKKPGKNIKIIYGNARTKIKEEKKKMMGEIVKERKRLIMWKKGDNRKGKDDILSYYFISSDFLNRSCFGWVRKLPLSSDNLWKPI